MCNLFKGRKNERKKEKRECFFIKTGFDSQGQEIKAYTTFVNHIFTVHAQVSDVE